jgi:hypothetical protein
MTPAERWLGATWPFVRRGLPTPRARGPVRAAPVGLPQPLSHCGNALLHDKGCVVAVRPLGHRCVVGAHVLPAE